MHVIFVYHPIIIHTELIVGFEEMVYNVTESEGEVEVCVAILSPGDLQLSSDLSVTLSLSAESTSATGMAQGRAD